MEVCPMTTARKLLVLPLILFTMASSSAFADLPRQSAERATAEGATADQQHLVTPSQLAAAVADHVAQQDADRSAIHEALAQPQVQKMATSMGIDLARANAAVDTVAGVELARAADAARQVNQQLVGGASTIVISTTTIIIILLLVIILIIAIK
jgi:hypothetical protein